MQGVCSTDPAAYLKADYRPGTALDQTVKNIIRKMAIADRLWNENAQQLRTIGGDVLPDQVGLF